MQPIKIQFYGIFILYPNWPIPHRAPPLILSVRHCLILKSRDSCFLVSLRSGEVDPFSDNHFCRFNFLFSLTSHLLLHIYFVLLLPRFCCLFSFWEGEWYSCNGFNLNVAKESYILDFASLLALTKSYVAVSFSFFFCFYFLFFYFF